LPGSDLLRKTIEALIDRPQFQDDSGGHGVGPSLGGRLSGQSAAAQKSPLSLEPRIFADLEDTAPRRNAPTARLGSEIARAGIDLGGGVLRQPDDHGAHPGVRRATPPAFAPPADPQSVVDKEVDERVDQTRAAPGGDTR
jgi:hypothetical protein